MPVTIRKAVEADIPAMAALDVAGYRHSPFRAALFPPHQRVRPGDGDALDWFARGARRALASSTTTQHYLVAVEDDTAVVGMAIWGSPRPEEQGAPQKAEQEKRSGPPPGLPSYVGYEPAVAANEEIERMLDAQDTLDDKTRSAMWNLDAVVVDEGHRRKGIGKALVQWGIDQAAKDDSATWLIATSDGRKLYETMGFSVVGSGSRCGEAQHIMFRDFK